MFDEHATGTETKDDRNAIQHGNQGDRAAPAKLPSTPTNLTIAVSRESGARGGAIARRVGDQLGWQVYGQDFMEHCLQNELIRKDILDGLSPPALDWVRGQLSKSPANKNRVAQPAVAELVQMILALAADGEAIIVGRGAGFILPRETTLRVRLVAPLADRVEYMQQLQRLTNEEAARHVATIDVQRDEFIKAHFDCNPDDVHQYDLVINTSYIGEELSGALIIEAAKSKQAALFDGAANDNLNS